MKVKKKRLTIKSPVVGNVMPLEQLNDPMLAAKALGEGIAIECESDGLHAPCAGVVKYIHSNGHTFIIETDQNVQILTHMGGEHAPITVNCEAIVSEGKSVVAGQLIASHNIDSLKSKLGKVHVVVLVNDIEAEDHKLEYNVRPGERVAKKLSLFDVYY